MILDNSKIAVIQHSLGGAYLKICASKLGIVQSNLNRYLNSNTPVYSGVK